MSVRKKVASVRLVLGSNPSVGPFFFHFSGSAATHRAPDRANPGFGPRRPRLQGPPRGDKDAIVHYGARGAPASRQHGRREVAPSQEQRPAFRTRRAHRQTPVQHLRPPGTTGRSRARCAAPATGRRSRARCAAPAATGARRIMPWVGGAGDHGYFLQTTPPKPEIRQLEGQAISFKDPPR